MCVSLKPPLSELHRYLHAQLGCVWGRANHLAGAGRDVGVSCAEQPTLQVPE